MAGTEVTISWNDRPARAWIPEPLARRDLTVSVETARRTERAAAAVQRAADHLPRNWEPLARLLLRAEGVASSNIEGLRAPMALVATAELDPAVGGTAGWIADNLAAVTTALTDASRTDLTVDALHRWHGQLMRHSPLPEPMIGNFRSTQGWIGGASPLDAVYVPPPSEHVATLMDDLVTFTNRDDIDVVTQTAVAHAQFETIHPYGDGNGRIGRMLIGWILVKRERVAVPPPVSVLIARDPGGYLSGLHAFRADQLDTWVRWFADVLQRASDTTDTLIGQVATLTEHWTQQLTDIRTDATARAIVDVLPSHPVINAMLVATDLGVSERAARDALNTLHERGILEPFDVKPTEPGRPRQWWLAPDLINTLGT